MADNRVVRTRNLRKTPEFEILHKAIKEKSAACKEIHYCTSPGNFGDGLINYGTRQFLETYGIEYQEFKRPEIKDLISEDKEQTSEALLLVGGGGGWSKNFSSTKHFVEDVAPHYKAVIVLPTTYELSPPKANNVTCFARDRHLSFSTNSEAIFCHDMAFFIDLEITMPAKGLWRLFAFRTDREGHGYDRHFDRNIDVSLYGDAYSKEVSPFFNIIGNFSQVYTDRLHVSIAASMLGKRAFLVPGTYAKNQDFFRSSIAENYPVTDLTSWDALVEKQTLPIKNLDEPVETVTTGLPTTNSRPAKTGIWKIVGTNPLVLPINGDYYREPPRDYSEMTPNYLTRYDGHTLATDVFNSGSDLAFIGPPLLNLSETMKQSILTVDGKVLDVLPRWRDRSRISRMVARLPVTSEFAELRFGNLQLSTPVSHGHVEDFAGVNAVITLSRDNALPSVKDWLTNLVVNHGIDTAIIYDNKSAAYTREQLLATMQSVKGLKNGIVVDWPYKYGNTAGASKKWDSDFGQYMCWEHARWRFLRLANCVVISDVDEMPISSEGKTLVEHVQKTASGVFSYPVRDTPAVPRDGIDRSRDVHLHTDYLYADTKKGPYSRKIVYQPTRISARAQVGNHEVVGTRPEYSESVISRHVAGVHYSWRSGTFTYSHPERDANSATENFDSELLDHYKKTFPERF